MSLAKLVRPTIKAIFEYPQLPGFEIELTYLSKDELMKLRSKCVSSRVDRRTREVKEDIDNELFEKLYYEAIVTGWKGLKSKYLLKLGPFALDKDVDPESEEVFDKESAVLLMQVSTDFNEWVNTKIEDVQNFTKAS